MQKVFTYENLWFDMIKDKLENIISAGLDILQFQMIQGDDNGIFNLVVVAKDRMSFSVYENLFHQYEEDIREG